MSNPPWTLEVTINGFEGNPDVLRLLNKLTVTELAELSNCSKGYISQVKHGIRPPSAELVQAIVGSGHYTKTKGAQGRQAVDLFLQSRRDGLSHNTVDGLPYVSGEGYPLSGVVSDSSEDNGLSQLVDMLAGWQTRLFQSNEGSLSLALQPQVRVQPGGSGEPNGMGRRSQSAQADSPIIEQGGSGEAHRQGR